VNSLFLFVGDTSYIALCGQFSVATCARRAQGMRGSYIALCGQFSVATCVRVPFGELIPLLHHPLRTVLGCNRGSLSGFTGHA